MPAARLAFEGDASLPTLDNEEEETGEKSPYEKVLWGLQHNPSWVKDITLGRRVSFYRFRGELGQGNFSTVHLAFHELTRTKVAMKVIEKPRLDQKTKRMLNREITNMDAVAHPNIIRLFEVIETFSKIYLVLEYASGGELFDRVSAEGRLPEDKAAAVFTQVLSAVVYLHESSIIHRDIKAENVFFSTPNQVKLGDFGFSTRVSPLDQQLSTFCGSPPYAAPELYKDESYIGCAVDVWALGVLLFFMLTADMPFKSSTVAGLKRHIISGVFIVPDHVSETAKSLIESLLVQDPSLRPSPAEMLQHQWLCDSPKPQGPLASYMVTPRSAFECNDHTEAEIKAKESLADWGISENLIEEALPKAARSPVIGTYRILLHAIATKPFEFFNNEINGTVSSPSDSGKTDTPSPSGSKLSTPKKIIRKLTNGKDIKIKSRACTIL